MAAGTFHVRMACIYNLYKWIVFPSFHSNPNSLLIAQFGPSHISACFVRVLLPHHTTYKSINTKTKMESEWEEKNHSRTANMLVESRTKRIYI